jgi:hypothetical protein
MSRRRKARQEKAVPPDGRPGLIKRVGPRRAIGLLAAATLVSVALAAGLLLVSRGGDSTDGVKTAAIVDQLSLTQPNPDFVGSARSLLADAQYSVDYFPGEQVTVDLFRGLPRRHYDLIIFRVHAGITTERDVSSGEQKETEYVSLFTGEPYSRDKYPDEQVNRLGRAVYYEGADPLFGIGPRFIEESMQGTFDDTIIVMMGCDGLRSQRTAQAFLDKGASDFISWSKPVSAPHTDAVTERLLELLVSEGLDPAAAVSQTASELGPDPTYHAELRILSQ